MFDQQECKLDDPRTQYMFDGIQYEVESGGKMPVTPRSGGLASSRNPKTSIASSTVPWKPQKPGKIVPILTNPRAKDIFEMIEKDQSEQLLDLFELEGDRIDVTKI